MEADEDPFEDRHAGAACPDVSVRVEEFNAEPAYAVHTELCNYLTARQTTQRDIHPGETIKVRVWHFMLTAPNPAEAHLAIDVAGLRVLNERIPIPQAAGLIRAEVPVVRAIPAGAPVYFHLHNHGQNVYGLIELSAGPQTKVGTPQ
ncbi:MAG: hypothetical protein OXU20_14150 [Myxococcales bacterium]|nr:hypothetical protein [Myxococcales bacterium]MDD9968561.1 hypothetical protein [Myxococcales bacterium]